MTTPTPPRTIPPTLRRHTTPDRTWRESAYRRRLKAIPALTRWWQTRTASQTTNTTVPLMSYPSGNV